MKKLCNLDISTNYKDFEFYLMKKDFLGMFACWLVRQSPFDTPNIHNALVAFDKYLSKTFKDRDDVVKFSQDDIHKLINEEVFASIPEIEIFNHAKIEMEGFIATCSKFHRTKPEYDYVDLWALAHNIKYDVMRQNILDRD